MEYIKRAGKSPEADDARVAQAVAEMLAKIRAEGEEAVRHYARQFDKWEADFVLSDEKKAQLIASVPQRQKEDIQFAHRQVTRFAEAQKASLSEFSVETEPGVTLGQKVVPVSCAGCYVPGGRYAHAASAIMSVATAKVAGVPFIVAASPPRGDAIDPAVAYAMDLAGADIILEMGGVHAIATMAFGLCGSKPADILV